MNKILLYQSPKGSVEWLVNEQVVLKTFSGYIHGEDLRSAFNAGYEQIRKTRGSKWLSDNRGLPVYKEEDILWINTDWLPRMLNAGWKYWALVEPESNVGRLIMQQFRFFMDKGIAMRVFRTVEEALSWLNSRQQTREYPLYHPFAENPRRIEGFGYLQYQSSRQ